MSYWGQLKRRLLSLLGRISPPTVATTMKIVRHQLQIDRMHAFRLPFPTNNDTLARAKIQTAIAPILRKRIATSALQEIANSRAQMASEIRNNPTTDHRTYEPPRPAIPVMGYLTQSKTLRTDAGRPQSFRHIRPMAADNDKSLSRKNNELLK